MREGRAVHLVRLDKTRPAVLLTRQAILPLVSVVTVAPIVSRARGLRSEVPVGTENGLESASVVHCDTITSVPASAVGRRLGSLQPQQERALAQAILLAFDLDLLDEL